LWFWLFQQHRAKLPRRPAIALLMMTEQVEERSPTAGMNWNLFYNRYLLPF
jgi:hypothetical protein